LAANRFRWRAKDHSWLELVAARVHIEARGSPMTATRKLRAEDDLRPGGARIINRSLELAARRSEHAGRVQLSSIAEWSISLSAPPVQLQAFDESMVDLHDAVAVGNHEVFGDPLPQHLAVAGAVQLRERLASRRGSNVQAVAAQGVSGSGAALPHRETIQAAFGEHDVSGIRAHTDSGAISASKAIGADAYATGNAVAFAGQPDLHLAAHEAAHVVQQRAGVSLAGGVGQVGDRYEQHADAVADAVVRGEDAAPLLSAAGSGGGVHAVQRHAPDRHEKATIDGLSGSFAVEEIGAIYQANWERDFSQSSPEIASLVIAWRELKAAAQPDSGGESQARIAAFRAALKAATTNDPRNTCLGGYKTWEHMDQPDDRGDSDRRWAGKNHGLAGYILDARAHIKDQMVAAVDMFRLHSGDGAVGAGIDNWKATPDAGPGCDDDEEVKVEKPEGYVAPDIHLDREVAASTVPKGAQDRNVKSRGQVRADTTREAGNKPDAVSDLEHDAKLWTIVGQHLGRAMHAFEDFWAHSDWVELAFDLRDRLASGEGKSKGKDKPRPFGGKLLTGHFKAASKAHALGHKFKAVVSAIKGDQALMGKALAPGLVRDALMSSDGLAELEKTGAELILGGDLAGDEESHANIAKDQTEPGKDANAALTISVAANQLVFAPLRAIMNERSPAKAKSALLHQLALVDRLLQSPSPAHPLWSTVIPRQRG